MDRIIFFILKSIVFLQRNFFQQHFASPACRTSCHLSKSRKISIPYVIGKPQLTADPMPDKDVKKDWHERRPDNVHLYMKYRRRCNQAVDTIILRMHSIGMVYYSLTSNCTWCRSFRRMRPWAVTYISQSLMEGQRHNNRLNWRCFCLQRPKMDGTSS